MSSMKPSEWAMLVLLSVFWGGSFFFTEIALRGFQPFAIVFLRVVFAAIILAVVVFLGKPFALTPAQRWALAMTILPLYVVLTGMSGSVLRASGAGLVHPMERNAAP